MEKVVIQESFAAPFEKVWNALTRIDDMKQWYFENIDAFEPQVGTKSAFPVQSGERVFTHLWEVTEVEAPQKIAYNWKYAEYPGDSQVCFELSEQAGRTILTLTMETLEDFPEDIPEFKRESCIAGWKYLLGIRLREFVAVSN